MADVVTVTEFLEHVVSPDPAVEVTVEAPTGYCIVASWTERTGGDPQPSGDTVRYVLDGDDNLVGVVYMTPQGGESEPDMTAYAECVPIEAADPPTVGTATLTAGTVNVAYSAMSASSRVFLQRETPGGTVVGSLYEVTARTNGTGFTITAVLAGTGLTNALDTSVVAWQVIEP